MTSSAGEQPLKLLALDDGGVRGLSELLILEQVMHSLMSEENIKRKKGGQTLLKSPPKPCDHFDLIGGTGTGGVIALMLGRLQMDVDKAIESYEDLVNCILSDPHQRLWVNGKSKEARLEEKIKLVVKSVTGDPEAPLLEADEAGAVPTFVCVMNAYNMNAKIPALFRTYQSRETHSGCKIWEAARATSATLTLFMPIEIGGQPYIGGGMPVGCNNPSQVVLNEAKALFGARQIGCFVSIGSGQSETINITMPRSLPMITSPVPIDMLKAISMDCESTHEDMLKLDLSINSQNSYFRLNVEQGMQSIKLSDWEKLSIVEAHTRQYMRKAEVQEKLTLLTNAITEKCRRSDSGLGDPCGL